MTAAEKSLKNYQTKRQVQAIALVTLVVQNSALALLMRYSRRVPVKEGSLYAASTAVVCAEVVKVAASLLLQLKDDRDLRGLWQTVKRDIFCQPWDTQKMAVPAALYCMQNNLAYIAISNLDSPTYQLLYQMKILTTATFSVTLLGHALNAQQWASLCMLVAGVGLVQLTQNSTARSSYSSSGGSSSEFAQNSMMGLAAVAAACVTSGFAGVYFEKVLKASNVSIWIRNMQLAGYGAAIGLAGVYAGPDARAVVEHGFLYGYNWKVWGAVLLNSLGGLVVAVVVKYADNVVKGFATSISILMTSIFSLVFFNFNFNIRFMAGAAMVIYSTYLYGQLRRRSLAPQW
ncbi:nucleotide-sugar transporter-domain-containing protein [Tribonema minus]|uniref:Nucleotide-sugar transporter-domain-containing protein n=1 Tax=Tribonema minus TaxID=303371 RepID=A0A835Z583_9STRA|nr:nucleotide-sugar transporter-domain-containing protein [Tribonema minus]